MIEIAFVHAAQVVTVGARDVGLEAGGGDSRCLETRAQRRGVGPGDPRDAGLAEMRAAPGRPITWAAMKPQARTSQRR